MKNILGEKPEKFENLHGRVKYNCIFVTDENIEGKTVLDIGCGFGWFELYALQKKVHQITGIERSAKDLATAKLSVTEQRVKFQEGSALLLPFDDNSFDTVVCWDVIEHLPKHQELQLFLEVKRVLKHMGSFYLSTPFNSVAGKIFDPAWWLIGHRHYSIKELAVFANQTGFRLLTSTVRGGWWDLLGVLNLYGAKWIFRRSPFLQEFFDKKIDAEYEKKQGFMSVFVKLELARVLHHVIEAKGKNPKQYPDWEDEEE